MEDAARLLVGRCSFPKDPRLSGASCYIARRVWAPCSGGALPESCHGKGEGPGEWAIPRHRLLSKQRDETLSFEPFYDATSVL